MSHALVLNASLGDAAAVPEGHVVIVRVVTKFAFTESETCTFRYGLS
jgi:hypothetical protein